MLLPGRLYVGRPFSTLVTADPFSRQSRKYEHDLRWLPRVFMNTLAIERELEKET